MLTQLLTAFSSAPHGTKCCATSHCCINSDFMPKSSIISIQLASSRPGGYNKWRGLRQTGFSGICPACAGVFSSEPSLQTYLPLWLYMKRKDSSSKPDIVLLEPFFPLYPCKFLWSRLTTSGLACQLVVLLLLQYARPPISGRSPQNWLNYSGTICIFSYKTDFSR